MKYFEAVADNDNQLLKSLIFDHVKVLKITAKLKHSKNLVDFIEKQNKNIKELSLQLSHWKKSDIETIIAKLPHLAKFQIEKLNLMESNDKEYTANEVISLVRKSKTSTNLHFSIPMESLFELNQLRFRLQDYWNVEITPSKHPFNTVVQLTEE